MSEASSHNVSNERHKITADAVRAMKRRGEKVPMLTCYDYPMARLLDELGVPILLVGDSLGMVVLGFPDTTSVTMAHMLHHVSAVSRAQPKALVVGDLPFESYLTPDAAKFHARQLKDAGADAVKLEGGEAFADHVRAIVSDGVPVMGHLGMLPQSVRLEGGYRMKGKTEADKERLLNDAKALEACGAFAIVLELVQADAAKAITDAVGVVTIGIGSGKGCDGQVLVTPDLVGSFPWFRPKFAQARASVAEEITKAVQAFQAEVRG